MFLLTIDELKATVPIWKKELYEDGSSWKENKECFWTAPKTEPMDFDGRQEQNLIWLLFLRNWKINKESSQ